MTKILEDKIAVVYAAAGPVGRALAPAFTREGATVYLTGRHLDKARYLLSSKAG